MLLDSLQLLHPISLESEMPRYEAGHFLSLEKIFISTAFAALYR